MNQTSLEVVSEREIVITRSFDTPARILFDAWTKPELVKRWWAPASHHVSVVVCEADVRVGGRYRYVLQRDGGGEMAFSGTYSEVSPHTRLVYTNVFEPMAAMGAVIVTITLAEEDGRTRLTSHQLFPSRQARDGALATGMEHGMRETMDQLEALVAALC